MGKRSDFVRSPRDFYPTPMEAVKPLLPHLYPGTKFDEPCCGAGDLIQHLEEHGHICSGSSDIDEGATWGLPCTNALDLTECQGQMWITNPPWRRDILHPLIAHLSSIAPAWLLIDADWSHTRQSGPYMEYCRKIVSVGRVKWIPGSKMTGKDNAAWYLFDRHAGGATAFFGRAA